MIQKRTIRLLVVSLIGIVLSASVAAGDRCKMGDTEGCESKCTAKDADSCSLLGLMYLDGRGVVADVAKATELIKRACSAGSKRGCVALALLYETGRGVTKDVARAFATYNKACNEDNEMWGCLRLASAYTFGHGVSPDPVKATELMQRACDGGEPGACFNIALTYDQGKGVDKDGGKAAEIYKAACTQGHGLSCSGLASQYEQGRGITKDLPSARRYYASACALFVWPACTRVAQMYAEGSGGPKDAAKASALLKRACDHNDPAACTNESVAALAGTSCAGRAGAEAAACLNNLGLKTINGDSITEENTKAIAMYKMACELGEISGCTNYGSELFWGARMARDVPLGLSYLHRACKAKSKPACDYLKAQPAWVNEPDRIPAWALDGPMDKPGACRSFWAYAQPRVDAVVVKPVPALASQRIQAQLRALPRPAAFGEKLWDACVAVMNAEFEARKTEIDGSGVASTDGDDQTEGRGDRGSGRGGSGGRGAGTTGSSGSALEGLKVQGTCKGAVADADASTEEGRIVLERACVTKLDKCACSKRALHGLRKCDQDCGRFLSDDPNGPAIAVDTSSRRGGEKPVATCSPGTFRQGAPGFAGGSLWCERPRLHCTKGGTVFGKVDKACPASERCSNSGLCFPPDMFPTKRTNAGRGATVMFASECASGRAYDSNATGSGPTNNYRIRVCR